MKKYHGIRIVRVGRKAYLEFLRNLTPQILLLGFAIHVGKQLDFTSIDFSNWLQTLIFWVLFISFGFAFFINYFSLLSECFPDIDRLFKRQANRNQDNRLITIRSNAALFRSIFKNRPLVLIEIVFLTIFVNIVAAVILISGVRYAASLMTSMQG